MAKKTINENTMITIKNNTGGGIGFRTGLGILRKLDRPNSVMKIKLDELMQSISQSGVYNMFANGLILVDEDNASEIMDMLGLPELDDYVCTLEEIEDLLSGVDYDDLRNVLKWGTKAQNSTIITVANNKGIKDANVIQIIKDVTGVDVTIKPVKNTREVKKPARNATKAKDVEEVKPARKKTTPKQTVTKKTEEKEKDAVKEKTE